MLSLRNKILQIKLSLKPQAIPDQRQIKTKDQVDTGRVWVLEDMAEQAALEAQEVQEDMVALEA